MVGHASEVPAMRNCPYCNKRIGVHSIMYGTCFEDREYKKARGAKYRVIYFMPKCDYCGRIDHNMRINADYNTLTKCWKCNKVEGDEL